jgi:hypothetical protein
MLFISVLLLFAGFDTPRNIDTQTKWIRKEKKLDFHYGAGGCL